MLLTGPSGSGKSTVLLGIAGLLDRSGGGASEGTLAVHGRTGIVFQDPETSLIMARAGDDVMLVGHDPDFSMAVHSLTGAQVRMKKGGLAGIDRGELKVLLRTRELALMAQRERERA